MDSSSVLMGGKEGASDGKLGTVSFEQGLNTLLGTMSSAWRFGEVGNSVQFPGQKLMFDDFDQPDAQS
jgi:hypothetical protein